MNTRKNETNGWIRDALKQHGYSQRDLARAWGIADPSVSRFISGEEGVDPPLSRAVTLATMIGISLDDLAKGLGLKGRRVEPSVHVENTAPAVGTFSMTVQEPGVVRVLMCQDVSSETASELIAILGGKRAKVKT
jgi:transcriptional regulator with XRE-family HTH domain